MAAGLKIINGDWVITPSGKLNIIEESEKCLRDFGKMLQTDIEDTDNVTSIYRYNPNYGNIISRLISQGLNRMAILEVANNLMYTTIQNYLSLQESRNNLSAGEVITNVNYSTFFDLENPSVLIIPIKITTAEGITYDLGDFEEKIS